MTDDDLGSSVHNAAEKLSRFKATQGLEDAVGDHDSLAALLLYERKFNERQQPDFSQPWKCPPRGEQNQLFS